MKKDKFLWLFLTLFFFSGCKQSNQKTYAAIEIQKPCAKVYLKENALNAMPLPLERNDLVMNIKSSFTDYIVDSAIFEQDGPNYIGYTIKCNDIDVAIFNLDLDSTSLYSIWLLDSLRSVDQYGLRIGDKFSKLKEKRGQNFEILSDFHQHVYVSIKGSHIMYEIEGDRSSFPESNDDAFTPSEEIVNDWRIETIIWVARTN